MPIDPNILLDILLKKWELLWNQYKIQHEILEKKRAHLWLINGALFYGYFESFKNKEISIFVPLLISLIGFVVCLIWLIVLRRYTESIIITEQALRDTEAQWNNLCEETEMNRITLDNEVLEKGAEHHWRFITDFIDRIYLDDRLSFKIKDKKLFFLYRLYEENIIQRVLKYVKDGNMMSARIWLNHIIPSGFSLAWAVIILITIIK